MASVKIWLDNRRADKDGKYPIKIQIFHNGSNTAISTGIKIPESAWNGKTVKSRYPNSKNLNDDLEAIKVKYKSIIKSLSADGKIKLMSPADIKTYILKYDDKYYSESTFSNYLNEFINTTRINTKTYLYTRDKINEYTGYKNIRFEDINVSWLNKFDSYLIDRGLGTNTRGIIFRCMRSVFNRAINLDIIKLDLYPFRKFKIKVAKRKIKDNLTEIQIVKLIKYEPKQAGKRIAKDLFLLSFYLLGANPKDIFLMNKVVNGRIRYNRAKTDRLYDIKVEKEALEIIKKYEGDKKLLYFSEKYKDYDNFYRFVRKRIKMVGEDIGVPNITLYWARYTWATFAADLDIPKDTIALGLGHGTETVTDGYITYNRNKVDKANRMIIDRVNSLINI